MANTLTNLTPDIYAALDTVSRELVGFIPSVTRDAQAARVAVGQSLRSPVAPAASSQNATVGMSLPTAAYQTIGNKSITITKSKEVPISWQGEEIAAMNSGAGHANILRDQFAQAMRTLSNEIESDIAAAARVGASRAYGTSGTTPFASDLSASAQLRKILDDNGAPLSERSLVIDTSAGAKLRTLGQLTKANEAGTSMTLRDGELLNLQGFSVKESAQVVNVTAGTGASYLINESGGYAIGDTSLTLDTGSGTILAGDVITIGAHKYVVKTALASNVVVIQDPGLRAAVANNAAVTVNADHTANAGFTRSAIVLATRLPNLPAQGDQAIDRMVVTDPRSGISFEIALYPGVRMVTYLVSAAWGVSVFKNEHVATLLG